MDVNNISPRAGRDGISSCVAQFVRILLVDEDKNSLMSLAYQFEQQLFKVTTAESATIALSLFEKHTDCYDIIIADMHMPEMDISEFLKKLHGQNMTIPIILISKDVMMDSVQKALDYGVCYLFPKPPCRRDIANLWQHIYRGGARNQNRKNIEIKMISSDKENKKRKDQQIVETSYSSTDVDEDDDRNSNKSRIRWTFDLHKKFLQAIEILGSRPFKILKVMNEPGLTRTHVASHLQIYRKKQRKSSNMQKNANLVRPYVPPIAPLNNDVNTIINNHGVQVPDGNSEVQELAGAGRDIKSIATNNYNPGQSTSGSHQCFDGMSSDNDFDQFMQELDVIGEDIWDMIN